MWAQFDKFKAIKNVIIIVFDLMTPSNHPDVFVDSQTNYRKTVGVIIFFRHPLFAKGNQLKQQ